MQSPSKTLNKEIVAPLLSHREWKSLALHPCTDPLYRSTVASLLFPRSLSRNSLCCFSVAHLELAKNYSMILDSSKEPEDLGLGTGISIGFYTYLRRFACISCNSFAAFSLSDLISFSSSWILAVKESTTFCKGLTFS